MPGEFDFIRWIRAQHAPLDFLRVPPGDDLAVLRWKPADLLLVGVDQVLDGVHFESRLHPPAAIGRKVMNRNLSDCAAMACLPAGAVATVALPRGVGIDYAKLLYAGMRDAGASFDCAVIGGDTGSWDGKLVVTVTILGRSDGVEPITRGGATPGDSIYVTGPLGGSILGRHMTFEPRIALARDLARRLVVTAMMDLSDGLSRDLRQICDASGIGAIIEAVAVPIHTDAITLARRDKLEPLHHALHDGEDHELLFTSRALPAALADLPGVVRVGRVVAERGAWLEQADGSRTTLEPHGWEHQL